MKAGPKTPCPVCKHPFIIQAARLKNNPQGRVITCSRSCAAVLRQKSRGRAKEGTCTLCHETKPAIEMVTCVKRPGGLSSWCKECTRKKQAARRAANPHYQIEKKYGLTQEQFNALMRKQRRACAICAKKFLKRGKLCVDHDHETGAIRGLLCHACNLGLGSFRDDPARLSSAIEYLRVHA